MTICDFETMYEKSVLILLIFFFSNEVTCSREDIHRMFYKKFDTSAACFRRLNGTHQFGCSSPRNGAYGVIYFIDNETDVSDFLKNSFSDSYMLVLNFNLFRSEIMDKFIYHPGINGILVASPPTSKPPSHYTPDDVCPNSLISKCDLSKPWNPLGNRFLLIDWPFPIFYVNEELIIETIRNCSLKFNSDFRSTGPLCSLHMKSHMSGAVNSATCLRRISYIGVNTLKYCDPIGDQNIILPLGGLKDDNKVIIVSARLDTASLFDKIAPGAMTCVTSFVTLLATAHVFSTLLPEPETYVRKVIFMLFNGEAHDNIGSSRIVYDIEENKFVISNKHLTFDQIYAFIDISQVGSESNFYLHYPANKESVNIIKNISQSAANFSIKFSDSPGDLPPSSFQTFYDKRPDIPGVVVANYDRQFITKYYNGLFDNSQTLGYTYGNGTDLQRLQRNLAELASTLGLTLYKMVTDKSSADLPFPVDNIAFKIDEMLYCYLESRGCKYMRIIVGDDVSLSPGPPLPLYVGVQHTLNRITTITGFLLAYLTAPKVNVSKEKCTAKDHTYIWISGLNKTGGVCLNTTLKFTPAVSPAVLIKDYDWSSRKYSTWTESVWNELVLGMFLKPSRKEELIILFTGLTTSIISFALVYWIKKQPLDIFITPSPTSC